VTVFAPTEARASEIARGCQRMTLLRVRGADAEPFDDEQTEWLERGKVFEDHYLRRAEAKHGVENVERQVLIQHPLGVGHADAYVRPERLLVEVKSSSQGTLSTPSFENGVNQLRIYMRFHGQAERGALVMIDPTRPVRPEVFPVALNPEHVAEIDRAFAEIAAHMQAGTLPDRVCGKPSDGRSYLCPFVRSCFEGWEAPERPVIDEAAVRLAAAQLWRASQQKRQAEAEYEAAKQALAELDPPYGTFDTGPLTVTRTRVERKPAFSLKAWEAAGHAIEPLADYMRGGSTYETWRVARNRDGNLTEPDDYGSEAPF
jgi:hypothetical protein